MAISLSGQLADFDLPQIISVLEVGRVSGRLQANSPEGDGALFFFQGEIVAAEAGLFSGELAAFLVLSWNIGTFDFSRDTIERDRQIHRSNQGLCLEGMRLIDVSISDGAIYSPLAGTGVNRLADEQERVLAATDGKSNLKQIAAACGWPELAVCYFLEQLERAEVVTRQAPGTPVETVEEPRLRVLLVDDSKLMQKVLRRAYESDPGIKVVGVAENGEQALRMLHELKPDVVSLDLYMPVMDGVTALKRIMLSQPTPTVIVTSANPEDLDLTFESILRFGAIDFITKPTKSRGALDMQTGNMVERLYKAARVNLRGLRMVQPPPAAARKHAFRGECRGLIAAIAGTGGCLSFMQLVTALPTDLPFAMVGVLRFPESFLKAFVAYLNKCAPFDVQLANDGAPVLGGMCYLASEANYVRLEESAQGPVLRVKPRRDEVGLSDLFLDVGRIFKERGVGLILSGNREESLSGLASIRATNGITMAQLPESCVDPELPQRAIELELIDRVVLLPQISNDLSQTLMTRLRRAESGAESPERAKLWSRMSA